MNSMVIKSQHTGTSRGVILMVDDNPKNLQVLGTILNNAGYNIEFALNGHSALDLVRKKKFDLILLDVMMPDMDGFEVCRILKSDNEYKDIPVIFLSAQAEINFTLRGFEAGAADYIYKPFNKLELLSRVSSHLELKKSRQLIEQYAKNLEIKNKLVTQSLRYAKQIQKAVLISGYKPLKELREHFLLFEPKDIISGDFLWSHKIDDSIIIALIDCTGHGVPGALISMLGVTFLNEIVVSERKTNTRKILTRMSHKIVHALSQKGMMEEVHDGMDASIISLNLKQMTLQYSGAFSSLYLIRDNVLTKLKGDRRPVGYIEFKSDFSSHKISLVRDDNLYIFSDGFPDQFGGKSGSKLKSRSFLNLLLEIHKKPLVEQKNILDNMFECWKGDLDQVDDVTVFGLKI